MSLYLQFDYIDRCLEELCLVWPAVLCITSRETTPLTSQDKVNLINIGQLISIKFLACELCFSSPEQDKISVGMQSESHWESVWMMLLQWIPLFSGTAILVSIL